MFGAFPLSTVESLLTFSLISVSTGIFIFNVSAHIQVLSNTAFNFSSSVPIDLLSNASSAPFVPSTSTA